MGRRGLEPLTFCVSISRELPKTRDPADYSPRSPCCTGSLVLSVRWPSDKSAQLFPSGMLRLRAMGKAALEAGVNRVYPDRSIEQALPVGPSTAPQARRRQPAHQESS